MKYLGPKADPEDLATQGDITGGGGAPLSNSAPDEITPDQTGAAGTSSDAARADHVHAISAAAPSSNLTATTTNAEGSSTSFSRADHSHALTTGAPTSNLTATTTNATGSSASLSRADHSHAITTGTPGTIQPDDSAAAGTSASLARADHVHAIAAGAASSITGTNAEGTSTSFARADHNHALGTGVVGATQLASSVSAFLVPTGAVIPFAGSTAPSGWLLCDGDSYSTTTYADLFAVIGYTYGNFSGLFTVPDLRSRVIVGRSTTIPAFDTLGKTGGEVEVTLELNEIPPHTHAISANQAANTTATGGQNRLTTLSNGDAGNNDATSGSTGGSGSPAAAQPHENLQPYRVLNYLIKT